MKNHPQKQFMQQAIEEAKRASASGQYALGALVVEPDNSVIAIAHTTLLGANDPTEHAEMNAIRLACKKLNSRTLADCWLYSTLEPCPMCTAAAIWAKMKGIVFGATIKDAQTFIIKNPQRKLSWRQIDIASRKIIQKGDPRVALVERFMRKECCQLFAIAKNP